MASLIPGKQYRFQSLLDGSYLSLLGADVTSAEVKIVNWDTVSNFGSQPANFRWIPKTTDAGDGYTFSSASEATAPTDGLYRVWTNSGQMLSSKKQSVIPAQTQQCWYVVAIEDGRYQIRSFWPGGNALKNMGNGTQIQCVDHKEISLATAWRIIQD